YPARSLAVRVGRYSLSSHVTISLCFANWNSTFLRRRHTLRSLSVPILQVCSLWVLHFFPNVSFSFFAFDFTIYYFVFLDFHFVCLFFLLLLPPLPLQNMLNEAKV